MTIKKIAIADVDWQRVACTMKHIEKTAASIRIEPYESIVDKAVKLVEKELGSGALSRVKSIVIEPSSSDHLGQVRSDKPDTIFLSLNHIKSLVGSDEKALVTQVAETIAHELGHLEANFQGGEGPAEARGHQFMSKLQADPTLASFKLNRIVRLAHMLDRTGHRSLASFCDAIWDRTLAADAVHNANSFAENVLKIVTVITASGHGEAAFVELQNKLASTGSLNSSQGRSKLSSQLAPVVALMKSLLAGQDEARITAALQATFRKMGSR